MRVIPPLGRPPSVSISPQSTHVVVASGITPTIIDGDLRLKDLDAMQLEIEQLQEPARSIGLALVTTQRASIDKAECTACQRSHATATVRVWLQKARNRIASTRADVNKTCNT